MGTETKIEWTDSTFNPWLGCMKVSPACDHCYAEVSAPSRTRHVIWGAGQERQRTGPQNWLLPRLWNKQADAFMAEHGRRRRVFCASLGDWLDNEVPIEWFVELLDLIRITPNIDWLLLSKRIGNFDNRMRDAKAAVDFDTDRDLWLFIKAWRSGEEVPAHVWLGATIPNQTEADRDIPKLLAAPARVHFLSMEPLLSLVNIRSHWLIHHHPGDAAIDWVISGGESGPKARPMHPGWPRWLRDQCAVAGVPFLFKQWGEFVNSVPITVEEPPALYIHPDGRTADEATAEAAGGTWTGMWRTGKKAAGRTLDGVLHDGYPQ